MKLKIDQAGRVILPKPLRDRLDLPAGSELEVTETDESILLTPVRPGPTLTRRNGLLVYRGSLPKAAWNRLLDDEREDRIRKLAGL